MRTRFTEAAAKHGVSEARVQHVLDHTDPQPVTTSRGDAGLLYVGLDADGEELEVITVTTDTGATLVIHAMPRRYRRR